MTTTDPEARLTLALERVAVVAERVGDLAVQVRGLAERIETRYVPRETFESHVDRNEREHLDMAGDHAQGLGACMDSLRRLEKRMDTQHDEQVRHRERDRLERAREREEEYARRAAEAKEREARRHAMDRARKQDRYTIIGLCVTVIVAVLTLLQGLS